MPWIRWLIWTKQDTKNEKTENGIRKTHNRITKRQKTTKKLKTESQNLTSKHRLYGISVKNSSAWCCVNLA